jgi:hypothetical protein
MIAVLMDEEPNQSEIREENLGFIILNLKTVIEAFDSLS